MKRTILVLLLAVAYLGSPHMVYAQTATQKSYAYMQIFFYGPKTMSGAAFMNFTPAFRNQKDVKLSEPNMIDVMFAPSFSGTQSVQTEVYNDTEDPKYKAAEKKRQQAQAQDIRKSLQAQEQRGQMMRDQLLKALNDAAVEGWEVIQMSAYGDAGLSYLLRRPE